MLKDRFLLFRKARLGAQLATYVLAAVLGLVVRLLFVVVLLKIQFQQATDLICLWILTLTIIRLTSIFAVKLQILCGI